MADNEDGRHLSVTDREHSNLPAAEPSPRPRRREWLRRSLRPLYFTRLRVHLREPTRWATSFNGRYGWHLNRDTGQSWLIGNGRGAESHGAENGRSGTTSPLLALRQRPGVAAASRLARPVGAVPENPRPGGDVVDAGNADGVGHLEVSDPRVVRETGWGLAACAHQQEQRQAEPPRTVRPVLHDMHIYWAFPPT
ncbi:MAG: hypothetical protein FJX72_08965 [Armatimonadetes bacterium]|nr:hypothetical protein [Armatimonadota bacterium]